MFKKKEQGGQGFSLVEIMAAIALSAVALSVGFSLLTLGNQISSRTEALLAANSAAFAKVQEYENKTFNNITIGVVGSGYEVEDFSADITATTGGKVKKAVAKVYTQHEGNSESLIRMKVIIDFQYGSRMRKIEYGTFIQLGGVGR